MSKKGKIFISLFLLLTIYLFIRTCKKENLHSNEYVNENFKSYESIYNNLNDTIKLWIDSGLVSVTTAYYSEWRLDSMICINSKQDKIVAIINESNGAVYDALNDNSEKITGQKISGNWYFRKYYESLTIPREYYKRGPMNPLTFYELSQIARKQFLESSLIENNDGNYIVDDKWIDNHFYTKAICMECKEKQEFDSLFMIGIKLNWHKKIDTNEYLPMKKHKYNI